MSATRLSVLFFALGATVNLAVECRAQAYGAEVLVENNDLRWFEPEELDLDGRIAPPDRRGWFFRADKLAWAYSTGDRVVIGDPDVVNTSEQYHAENPEGMIQTLVNSYIFAGATIEGAAAALNVTFATDASDNVITETVLVLDDDNNIVGSFDLPQVFVDDLPAGGTQGSEDGPPESYEVANGIQDAIPDAEFAWGERYEIGYSDGERGWFIGILDGPEQDLSATYGAGPDVLDDDVVDDGTFNFGFGSVAVNFSAPEDYFLGWRDYVQNNYPIGTQSGPALTVLIVGAEEDEGLPTDLGDIDPDEAPLINDDLNGNGGTFFLIGEDLDGDGTPDTLVGTVIDFGDLYEFDIYFDDVTIQSVTEMDGVEFMSTFEVDLGHKLDRGRRDYLQLSYGVRYMQLDDFFSWGGTGSVLGGTGAAVDVANQIIGPQVGFVYTRDRGRWDFIAEGRLALGYNRVDTDLNGIIGEGLIPQGTNSINGRTTTTVTGTNEEDFSPIAELRLGARYKFAKGIAFNVGYTGKFIDNIRRASLSQVYSLPELSLQDGKSELFVNGFDMGFELRY